jgi:membrane-associated protease RseP (regulator of RpoE activity)
VRTHFFEVVSALAPRTLAVPLVDGSIQAGGSPPVVEFAPEDKLPRAMRPTSLRLAKNGKGHRAASAQHGSSHGPVRDTFAQALDRGIRKLAEHHYEIKRSTMDLALGNLGLLARAVRVTPEVRDGKPFGFRLFAMMDDGPVAQLGLQNDDVLVSINGFDLATADRVLDAYGKFKTASHLVLGLIRERREIFQAYTIR